MESAELAAPADGDGPTARFGTTRVWFCLAADVRRLEGEMAELLRQLDDVEEAVCGWLLRPPRTYLSLPISKIPAAMLLPPAGVGPTEFVPACLSVGPERGAMRGGPRGHRVGLLRCG